MGEERESLMVGSEIGLDDVGEVKKSKSTDVLKGEKGEVEIPGGRGIATPGGGSIVGGVRAGLSLARNCISSKITWREMYTRLSLGSVTFLSATIANEQTLFTAKCQLVGCVWSKQRITCTPKSFEKRIVRMCMKKSKIR